MLILKLSSVHFLELLFLKYLSKTSCICCGSKLWHFWNHQLNQVIFWALKELFYSSLHSSVHTHASEPTSVGSACSSGQLTISHIHALMHSSSSTFVLAILRDTSTCRPQSPEIEKWTTWATAKPPYHHNNDHYDIMWHKVCTNRCCRVVFNLVFGHVMWPFFWRSHDLICPTIKHDNCIQSVMFPLCVSHRMWQWKLKKGKYKWFDSARRVCPQCVWICVVERVTDSFLSLLPWGSHHTSLSMKVMFGGWKQY